MIIPDINFRDSAVNPRSGTDFVWTGNLARNSLPCGPMSIRFFWLAVLCCAAGVVAAERDNDAKQPNVVSFLVDDLGWTDLRCYGSDFYRSPHIDRLATDGIRFTNAYAACNACSPTRAAILTGYVSGTTATLDAPEPTQDRCRFFPAFFLLLLVFAITQLLRPLVRRSNVNGIGHTQLGARHTPPSRNAWDAKDRKGARLDSKP